MQTETIINSSQLHIKSDEKRFSMENELLSIIELKNESARVRMLRLEIKLFFPCSKPQNKLFLEH